MVIRFIAFSMVLLLTAFSFGNTYQTLERPQKRIEEILKSLKDNDDDE